MQSTHLQMLEAGTLGGWTRGVIVAEDSLHEVPGQQQAAGLLSGYPCRALEPPGPRGGRGASSPRRSRAWRRPGRASCMVHLVGGPAVVLFFRGHCVCNLRHPAKRRATSDDKLLVAGGVGGISSVTELTWLTIQHFMRTQGARCMPLGCRHEPRGAVLSLDFCRW